MKKHFWAAVALLPVLATSHAANAEEAFDACQGKFTFAETNATFEDFDFWVGTWQVLDSASGQLRGFDDINYIADGCVLKQTWNQMDDLFSPASTPMRLQGHSLTGIDATGAWRQMWTDNNGGNIILTGGLQDDGSMVLISEWIETPSRSGGTQQIRYHWHWMPQDDGTIHNWGFAQTGSETGPMNKYFDIIYRRHIKGGPAFNLRVPE